MRTRSSSPIYYLTRSTVGWCSPWLVPRCIEFGPTKITIIITSAVSAIAESVPVC